MPGPLGGLLLLALAGTPVASAAAQPTATPYVVFDGQPLTTGRTLWLANCETCHGYGIAGAPIPMEPTEWQGRLRQPMAVLYDHALNGFFGPDDAYMPPRGGNPELSDAEIRSAVDYVTALARYYIDRQSTDKRRQ